MDDTEHVKEARQMAMRTIDQWEYLNDEEKHGVLHEIVDQLAKAEDTEQTPQQEWEAHNEQFSYEPPEKPGDAWSSDEMQELTDRVIRRQTQWLCQECTGHGPMSSLQRARRHVEGQHLTDLIQQHETPRDELETVTDGGESGKQKNRGDDSHKLEDFSGGGSA